jgi:hypothetical protein
MRALLLTSLSVLILTAAGCGGSGSNHTYVLAANSGFAKSFHIYVTIASPVAIPKHLMTQRGARVVNRARGPQVCSFT